MVGDGESDGDADTWHGRRVGGPGYLRLISLLTSLSIVPTISGVSAVNTTLYSDM